MIGLMVLGFWVLYFLVSIALAKFVTSRRRNSGDAKATWWGVGVFVLMWALVIQDYPLMEMEYQRLCKTEGGFRQYKTAEQWQQENPGVWETLEPVEKRDYVGDLTGDYYYMINQRFRYVREHKPVHFGIRQGRVFIQDIKTEEIIAEDNNFISGPRGRDETMRFLFFWRNHKRCFPPPNSYFPSMKFDSIHTLFENGNKGEQQ